MQQMDLGGEWQLRWYDGQRGKNHVAAERDETDPANYLPAQVPGEVHLDLMRAGILADTNLAANVLAARWVEESFWTYRRTFPTPDGAGGDGRRVWLVFERLDLVARVVLNGVEVAQHGNAFRPLRVDVTGKLRADGRPNVLVVHVESGLFESGDKPGKAYAHHEDGWLHKRHWSRKPQSQFGWDWAPRLLNVGVTGPVRLEWTDAPVRVERFVPLASLGEDLKSGRVRGRVFVEGLRSSAVRVGVTLTLRGTGRTARAEATIEAGEGVVEVELTVESPELWWPIGHGEPRLYTVDAVVEADGQAVGTWSADVGFRHVRWDQSPHPQTGQYFRLFVNGRPIFCKGGNFVPADTITARVDADRYRRLVDLAIEANFNFMRVWGGGVYEDDAFYELCDRRGLLVWQEFIYACSKYPTIDEAFHEEAKREARYQIRRLASHASLIAWCGNNEMEEANWHWGYDKRVALPDHAFFHITLPRLMAAEDPTRYYQPSSPMSPMGIDPRANDVGDQHPWSLGFFDVDVRKYRQMICRFPNEGGTLGPTSLPTMRACLDPRDERIGSFAWRVHDNSIAQWAEPSVTDGMTGLLLGKPIAGMTVEQYVYWGGVAQGEGLKEYIDNFRRRMFDSAAAIFWMYNDVWPAVRSWTIIDYYLRRTPAFAYVRRALAPVHVVLAHEGERVSVYGVNETQAAVTADLRYGLFGLAGGYPVERSARVTLAANASTCLATFEASKWTDPTGSGAFAVLGEAGTGKVLARNRLFLPLMGEMKWAEPAIEVRRDGARLVFRSDQYVAGVCLDLDGGPIGDNFFDLLPGVEHAVEWPGDRRAVVRVGDMSKPTVALREITV